MEASDKVTLAIVGGAVAGAFIGFVGWWSAYRVARPTLIAATRDKIVSQALQTIPAEYGPLAQALRVPGVATWVADQVATTMNEKLP